MSPIVSGFEGSWSRGVIGTAWSRDGSLCYMRVEEFRGMELPPREMIYVGRLRRGTVEMFNLVPLVSDEELQQKRLEEWT